MYIRIQHQTIRYRISRQQAQLLIDGEFLTEELILNDEFKLIYSVCCTDSSSLFSFNRKLNQMNLQVNLQQLQQEISDRPSKQGIVIVTDQKIDSAVSVFLEIDIKKTAKSAKPG